MRHPPKALLALVCCLACSVRPLAAATVDQDLAQRLGGILDHYDFAGGRTHDLLEGALLTLTLGRPASGAEALLAQAWPHEVMDPASPDYGKFAWYVRDGLKITDLNASCFCLAAVGPLLLGHGSALSATARADAITHARAGLNGVRARSVSVDYTNIFLMRAVDLALVGGAVGDTTSIDQGVAALDQWLAAEAAHGIGEYTSPTYGATDLGTLSMGVAYATRADVADRCRRCLSAVWTHLGASAFAVNGTLAGPASRTYDPVSNHGEIEDYLRLVGLRSAPGSKTVLETVFALEAFRRSTIAPPSAVLTQASKARFIRQKVGTASGQDVACLLSTSFWIGSATRDYGAQDLLVACGLASTSDLGVIKAVVDGFDEPYGVNRHPDNQGKLKPYHMPSRPVCVQRQGAVLATFVAAPDPNTAYGTTLPIATDVVVPLAVDRLERAGVALPTAVGTSLPLAAGDVIGLRLGHAGVAIRVLLAEALGGPAAPQWQVDAVGGPIHLGRIVIPHRPAGSSAPDSYRVSLLLLAREVADDNAFAVLQADARSAVVHSDPAGWSTSVAVDGHTLAITRGTAAGAAFTSTIDGATTPTPIFDQVLADAGTTTPPPTPPAPTPAPAPASTTAGADGGSSRTACGTGSVVASLLFLLALRRLT